MDDKERRLRGQAAVVQADLDHDWMYFDEHVEELEKELDKGIKSPIVRSAAKLVVVQIYSNRITRDLEQILDMGEDHANPG